MEGSGRACLDRYRGTGHSGRQTVRPTIRSRRKISNHLPVCSQFPPICLGIGAGYPSTGQDEDCLFVNVWAPSNATTQSNLPVWLFIQGGGKLSERQAYFVASSLRNTYPLGYVANTNANWDGAEVVEKSGHNVVLVNFNYRVGLWGFLASERVRGGGDLNVGLLDQRMLMTWVKTHITSVRSLSERCVWWSS